jgi:ubiquinone biosynthesis protein
VIAALYHLLRLTRAGFVFAREGVFALVDTRPLPLPAKTAVALARLIERPSAKSGENRLAAALTRLGPTYVKLGQFLATRPDVVGTAIARDLESLQDKMKRRSPPRSISRYLHFTQASDLPSPPHRSHKFTALRLR